MLNIAELIEVEMSYQIWAGVLGKCLGINKIKYWIRRDLGKLSIPVKPWNDILILIETWPEDMEANKYDSFL